MNKKIERLDFLEMENINLKIKLLKTQTQQLMEALQRKAQTCLESAGLDLKDWSINLDTGQFDEVRKQKISATK